MIELFLQNRKVDITKDIDVSITYEMNDLSDPQAVKNNYSKTVTLEGTPNNNRIFGDIYRFDKEILDNDSLIGADFNPNKRVDYYIVDNGDVIDSGYFQLDEISYSNNRIQYNITLYGGIGDFFYNLMYSNDDEEEQKTLSSLYYGIDNLSKEDEDKLNLFEYDKDFIKECWRKRLNNELDKSSTSIFCPIPSHNGLYDEFDSDTIITNEVTKIQDIYVDPESGERYGSFESTSFKKVTVDRELSEWEVGDIRSHQQRLGVRMQDVYDAIKNPINNGGYTVDDTKVDEHSKAYIKDAYIMLDKFDYETINQTNKYIDIEFSKQPILAPLNSVDTSISQSFDVSEFVNPHITVSIVPELKSMGALTGDICTTIFAYGPVKYRDTTNLLNGHYNKYGYLLFGSMQFYYLRLLDENGNSLGITKPTIFASYDRRTTDYIISNTILRGVIEKRLLMEASRYFPEYNYNFNELQLNCNWEYYYNNDQVIQYAKNTSIQATLGKDFVGYEQIDISTELPKNCKKVKLESLSVATKFIMDCEDLTQIHEFSEFSSTLSYDSWNKTVLTNFLYTSKNAPIVNKFDVSQGLYFTKINDLETNKILDYITVYKADGYMNNTEDNITQIYDGAIASNKNRHVLNKKQIFSQTKTPFDYLISMGKLFNWIFEKDVISKTINIYSKYNYYDKKIIDISDKIDRKSFKVIPSTLEYNKYMFNLPLPDTYSTELFKKKNNRIYSQFVYKPNYQFNSESYEVLEDNSLTLGQPYMMHSIYLTDTDQYPVCVLGTQYTVTYYSFTTDSTVEKQWRGLLTANPKVVSETNDSSEKICCFDKENSYVTEMKDVFVLYNGKVETSKKPIYLSNDIPLINQINENNCYLMTRGMSVLTSITSSDRAIVQDRITEYPSFTNNNDKYSLLFNEVEGKNDLWNLFYKNDITNIYNRNSKIMIIDYMLLEKPIDALKHFYLIDNSIWIINKINNYNPNNNALTEVEFIRLTDYENFCKPIIKVD